MADTVIANQLTGLPMFNLISAPLEAISDAQKYLAASQVNFLQEVGMDKDGKPTTVPFAYQDGENSISMTVPTLAIVETPSLVIKSGEINLDIEVSTQAESKSSTDSSAELSVSGGWGPVKASFTGKVSHHSENTRKTDTSAKYSVKVVAEQEKSEGLMKVLDAMTNAIGKDAKSGGSGDGS